MPALKPLLIDEFLDWDSGDDRRYELVDGVPVAMAAPSAAHQILAANLTYHFVGALISRPPCTTRSEAPIAIVDNDDQCHVADIAVTCRPHGPGQRLVPEPIVIVEILSPSTESKDRKVKLPDYRAIPSVREIVLLDQQQFYCEVHRRLDDGRWLTDLLRHADAELRLESIDLVQPLSAIYANVSFEE
jgi:Uma2 family endonuclease